MRLGIGGIVFIVGLGGFIAGLIQLAQDPWGLGFLLGGAATAFVAVKIMDFKLGGN
ncbi:hypothetical protein LCGC14_1362220 [marine sediment metagenome]|uniref:Uncharacterized protein n=1 Tax=marine sediment metagenome TaxID=412755 RepID=A0A0F9MN49_9ZZZZ